MKKGFVPSAILLLVLVLMVGILNNLQNKKTVLDTLKPDTIHALDGNACEDCTQGKILISAAITNKGIPTLSTDTFEVMADNIGQIQTGISEQELVNTLVEYLQYSDYGFTSDMSLQEIVDIFKEKYPAPISLVNTDSWTYTNTNGTYGILDGGATGSGGTYIRFGQGQGPTKLELRSGTVYSEYVDITKIKQLTIVGYWSAYAGTESTSSASLVLVNEAGTTLATIFSGSHSKGTSTSSTINSEINQTINLSGYTGKVRLKGTFSTYSNWWSHITLTTCEFIQ